MSELFISFEGGEGAGKSTLAASVRDALKSEGYDVVFTREPGGTKLGDELRNLLLHHKDKEISPLSELFLFLAARVQHIEEVIKPALDRGAVVLCDRFSDSTIAYQGEGKKLGFDFAQELCLKAQNSLAPSLTFFVDLDPVIGLKRTDGRRKKAADANGRDRMEKENLEFHKRVRSGFQRLAALYPERIHTLDGRLDPDTLFQQAISLIRSKLKSVKTAING